MNKHIKKRDFKNRKHKVKTINLNGYHEEIIKRKRLNLSSLCRELLDDYFKTNFPELFEYLKSESKNE